LDDIEELGFALRSLPNGKTPGTDGFGTDFYKFWWPHIKDLVHESLMYSLETGHLSVEQRRGAITLIPKKDKDVRHLKNWRPISLLNTDYKMLTKLLATRMQQVISPLIHPDQVGYIRGRYIGQNIRTISDIIEYAKITQTPGLIAFLDFEKAFDSIEWDFMTKALCKFGFGEKFINWVRIVYKDSNSCILNNGFTTEYFCLERGIRQGCPLSVYLFILAAELLAVSIRGQKNIKGIQVFYKEVKIIQMADDTTVFLRDSASLNLLMRTLHLFSLASGLRLNKTKTEAIWVGSNEGSNSEPCGIKWATEVYALGIWFCIDNEHGIDRNFAEKYDKFCRALNMWRGRDLTLKGKITVIKSIALPILLYVASNLPVSEDFIKKVTKDMYSFLWNNKPEKIKRKTLISDIKSGGLKMIDFGCMVKAQKVMWAKRLISQDNSSWKAFPMWCLGKIGTSILQCQIEPDCIPIDLTAFYQQVLRSWAEIKQCEEVKTAWDVRRQSIVFNKHILIDGHYVWQRFIDWFDKGIFLIHDIVDSKGNFLTIQNLRDLYNAEIDVLSYNSLKDAVPNQWRHLLKQMSISRDAISSAEEPYIVQHDYQLKPMCLLSNKLVYTLLIQHKVARPTCIEKWSSLYTIDDSQWANIFQLPFIVARCTHLQALQYKIVHRIYPCNYWVSKWEPDTNIGCGRCGVNDTLEHHFYKCNTIQLFWKYFENWWASNMQERIKISDFDVLFGYFKETQFSVALNL
jgi:hypothetical protein